MCGRPDLFRIVRDLGRVCACCSRESEVLERGIPLIRRWEVGVPVHELPLAVDAAVDMGDPDYHVARRAAVDADVAPLEATV
jgi:hypothetical protein